MTTSTDSAAGRGLPDERFPAGWYCIKGNSDNRLPRGEHEAFIRPIPASSRLYMEVEICGFLPMHFSGPRTTIEAMIVARIPGQTG